MNLKIPGTVFLLALFSNIKKQNTYKSWHNFLLIFFFQILKSILTNLKIPDTIFCSSPFSNIKKAYLQILAQFFAYSHFQISKKHTYKSWHNFLLIPFSNIKKEYFQILKNPAQWLFLFQMLKKNT